jgi:hypothetical protein
MLFKSLFASDNRHRRIPRGVPRNLSPRLMRDIGLEPWPERLQFPPRHLW